MNIYIAIVIPTKNEEKYLPYLIDSIQNQSYKDFVIIIADAKSTDKTRELAEQKGCIVIDGGLPYAGRNLGAQKAVEIGADLIIFMDSDIILPNKYFLEKSIDEFYRRNLDIAGTLQVPYESSNNKIKKSKNLNYLMIYEVANIAMVSLEKSKKPMFQVCMFVKPEVHKAIGGFRSLEFAEDSQYSTDAKTMGYNFGILKTPDKVYISPRRYKTKGFFKSGVPYFLVNYIFGKNFELNKAKRKYFD